MNEKTSPTISIDHIHGFSIFVY